MLECDGPQLGDVLPAFCLPNQRGKESTLSRLAVGLPILICHLRPGADSGADSGADPGAILALLARHWARLRERARLVIINGDSPARNDAAARAAGLDVPFLSDPEGQVAADWGLSDKDKATLLLIDANQRISRILRDPADVSVIQAFLDAIDEPALGEAREHRPRAPVLYVPAALNATDCAKLIALYHAGGNAPSGVFRHGMKMADAELDDNTKSRRDHIVQDPDWARSIGRLIGKRVVPEMKKAFGFEAKFVKEFKICRYGADERGFFRPHRDNYGDPKGRAFAMTLNLNSGDYQGGHLRFPEYGPELYRPETGDAVIFSCALLHEAMPVTAGERFVLLTFFYGADGDGDS